MRGFAPLLKLMLAWALALVTALASAAGLGSLLGGRSTELLPPDEAYRLEMRVVDARTLAATLTPAPDYYLYRDRIHFTVEDPPGVVVEDVSLPKGEPKQDPTFGQVDVYHHPIEAVIRLSAPVTGPVRVHATYQGCNEPKGVCYPPIEMTLTLTPPGSAVSPAAASATPATLDHSETGRIRSLFGQGTPALLAAFFGFGVLLAFTPCMLPMIPILSGIVVGQARHASKGRALLLSAAYVLGMALTYAAAGVAAGL
ncbi:MAG: thiol:disulfide interchange protein, partial [Frateuria sp.]|nr:thiol:disulfide interchange protein [Frateuria sp.]